MRYGIVKKPVITIYQGAYTEMVTGDGSVSAIADEGLHGMIFAATGEESGGFVPVRSFYGYSGYAKAGDFIWVREQEAVTWENSKLCVVSGFCVDVVSLPGVRGVRLISLYRGSIVRVLGYSPDAPGWLGVGLADGRTGYLRREWLWEKAFSQAGAWSECLPQRVVAEQAFRDDVVGYGLTYPGTQYRWGGRSTAGLDCSGFTSACYMLCGILICRDAKIEPGYPVREIPTEAKKRGDLLYFPGHIALYMGEGKYLHSTGKADSSGVRINSLIPGADGYRQDLADSLYAVGSIF